LDQGGNRSDKGGLAGAVGPEQGDDLAALGDEVEAAEGLDLPEPFRDLVRFDDGSHEGSFWEQGK